MTDASPDWSRAFDDPIPVPDGRVLETLHDAGHYAAALPKAVQERAEWQAAAEMLILAAQGQRPVMFADIAMRQALHAGKISPCARGGASRRRTTNSFVDRERGSLHFVFDRSPISTSRRLIATKGYNAAELENCEKR